MSNTLVSTFVEMLYVISHFYMPVKVFDRCTVQLRSSSNFSKNSWVPEKYQNVRCNKGMVLERYWNSSKKSKQELIASLVASLRWNAQHPPRPPMRWRSASTVPECSRNVDGLCLYYIMIINVSLMCPFASRFARMLENMSIHIPYVNAICPWSQCVVV